MYYIFAARICSIHFTENSFMEDDWLKKSYNLPMNGKRLLKNDAIPTLHLQAESTST